MNATAPRPLTARQAQLLRLIYRGFTRDGQSPSYRDLMRETGLASPNVISGHLDALVRKGYVLRHHKNGRLSLVGVSWAPVFSQDEDGRRLKEALEERT